MLEIPDSNIPLVTGNPKAKVPLLRLRKSKLLLALRCLTKITLLGCCALVLDYYISSQKASSTLFKLHAILSTFIFLQYIIIYFNDLYVFGQKRIVHFHGLLSLKLKRTSIAYVDIREINIKQTVLGRILNFGNLRFGTASTSSYEIQLIEIPKPTKLTANIEKYISSLRKKEHPGEPVETRQVTNL